MFIPKETAVVAAPISALRRDTSGAVDSGENAGGVNYLACVPDALPRRTLTAGQRSLYTALPENIDLRVRLLSLSLFHGLTTRREKIGAVLRYFHRNYTYHYGIRIPEGVDAVTHFLLQRPPAHCEYFASAMVVLARSVGLPSRLVNGFAGSRKNPMGDFVELVGSDAHAWVEIHYEEAGWVRYDPTPPDLRLRTAGALSLRERLAARRVPQALIDRADLVTEMVEGKHYYAEGVKARRGIEF